MGWGLGLAKPQGPTKRAWNPAALETRPSQEGTLAEARSVC